MHGPIEEPNKANQGFMNNPGLIIASNGVILVDPGGTYQVGKQVLAEAKKISDKPVLAVFNTHIHGDHWLGNQAVKEAYPDAKIYGHPKMIEQAKGEVGKSWLNIMETLTEGASIGTKVVPADTAVKHGEVIKVDDQQFKMHVYDPAHTDTDILIEHINSKTLFMGDNSFNKRMGRFDTSSNMHGSIKLLQSIDKNAFTHFIPGHGQSGDYNTAVKPFLDYLLQLQQIVKTGLEQDMEDYEIKPIAYKKLQSYKDWRGFDERYGKHVFKMYLETQARAF
jgi:glyoxylase-like metal-dependent hydrolase (beta-lactamase superfamily II)